MLRRNASLDGSEFRLPLFLESCFFASPDLFGLHCADVETVCVLEAQPTNGSHTLTHEIWPFSGDTGS